MVRQQIEGRGIKNPLVLEAFRAVDRKIFVPPKYHSQAYNDHPLSIGKGQTISQPYMVAEMTELLELKGNERVLEIGTGSGYQTAILAMIAEEVFTIEIIPSLSELAQRRLEEMGIENVNFKTGSGFEGWEEEAPFDSIIVTAAPEEIPVNLMRQLADGGRMVIPVGKRFHTQSLYLIERDGDEFKKFYRGAVAFVPMVREAEDREQ